MTSGIELAPIALFVYNRPDHTRGTLEALSKNHLAKESRLFVFSDGAKPGQEKRVNQVREVVTSFADSFSEMILESRDENWGLARNIISGVSQVIRQFGSVIVLEDDLLTSPYFLTFMNDALNKYESNDRIFSVTGFNYPREVLDIPPDYEPPVYLSYRTCSWGWGTWTDRWGTVDWEISDFDDFSKDHVLREKFARGGRDLFKMLRDIKLGKLDSWAIRFIYAQSMQNKYTVYPVDSFLINDGYDELGTNCKEIDKIEGQTLAESVESLPERFDPDPRITDAFQSIFDPPSFMQRAVNKIRRVAGI